MNELHLSMMETVRDRNNYLPFFRRLRDSNKELIKNTIHVIAKYYFIIFIILLKYGQIDFMTSQKRQKLIQVCMIHMINYSKLYLQTIVTIFDTSTYINENFTSSSLSYEVRSFNKISIYMLFYC